MKIVAFLFGRLPQAFVRFFLSFGQTDVIRIRHDATSDRFVHLFVEHTLSRKSGGTVSAFQHALLDLTTYRVRSGPRQVGAKLELDSPFVERSLARASKRAGVALAVGRGVGHKGIRIQQSDVERFGDIQSNGGRELHVQSRSEPSSGDSMATTSVKLSYFIDRQLRWSMQGSDAWHGADKCFRVAGDRFCILYSDAVDTRLLVLDAASGVVLADRYLLPIFYPFF